MINQFTRRCLKCDIVFGCSFMNVKYLCAIPKDLCELPHCPKKVRYERIPEGTDICPACNKKEV